MGIMNQNQAPPGAYEMRPGAAGAVGGMGAAGGVSGVGAMSAARASSPKKGKKAKVAGAAALAAVLALSSTFAWTSFSQQATNEFRAEANAGGRLHDDFSFTQAKKNKDIYVENFTSEEDGAPIFARVQLKEYLEIGARAGQEEPADPATKGVTRYPEAATMDDASAWTVYTPADTSSIYRERFNWTEGGSSTFMPTFNKNKDSLEADINGSYRDEAGPYTNYTEYTDGQTLEGSAIYDADDNAIDEGESGVEGTNFTTQTETHTAKATGTATVMSMAEWKAAGSAPGPYWVYDTDGWAYWAQAIQPGEATGLLLDNVDLKAPTGDTWYYGIHATGEFVSNGEWKQDGSSYYMDQAATKAITSDAFALLTAAADALTAVEDTSWIEELKSASPGDTITIGNHPYYFVSYSDDNNPVLITKEYIEIPDADSNCWRDNNVRAFLNNEYLKGLPQSLQDRIAATEVTTMIPDSTSTYTTTDKVFLAAPVNFLNATQHVHQEERVFGGEIPSDLITGKDTLLRTPASFGDYTGSFSNSLSSIWGDSASVTSALPVMIVQV